MLTPQGGTGPRGQLWPVCPTATSSKKKPCFPSRQRCRGCFQPVRHRAGSVLGSRSQAGPGLAGQTSHRPGVLEDRQWVPSHNSQTLCLQPGKGPGWVCCTLGRRKVGRQLPGSPRRTAESQNPGGRQGSIKRENRALAGAPGPWMKPSHRSELPPGLGHRG